MRNLRKKIIVLFGSAALLLGCLCSVQGQYARSRTVRVYRPGTYSRTRAEMSRRAALRKVFKKHRKAARKRRHMLH